MNIKNESDFSKVVRDIIKGEGGQASQVEAHASAAGIPDLDFCLDGVEGHVELKFLSDRYTPEIRSSQVHWMRKRYKAGGHPFYLCYDANVECIYVVDDPTDVLAQGKMPRRIWTNVCSEVWGESELAHNLIHYIKGEI